MDICNRVERQGIRCWIAPRDVLPGEDWARRIGAEIDRAVGFVVVLSRASNKSRPVKAEVEFAFNNSGLPIFPVQIDDITLDNLDRGLRFFVGSSHVVDAQPALRHAALDRMAQDIARTVLRGRGTRTPGGTTIPPLQPYADLAARVGADGPVFAKLWTAMDARGSRTAWLTEAFIGGLAWPFVRGMVGLGMAAAAVVALLVWTMGLIAGTGGAVALLLAGWLGAALLFGFFGADLLRSFHAAQIRARAAPSGAGPRALASLVSAALLVVATIAPGQEFFSPAPKPAEIAAPAAPAGPATIDPATGKLREVDGKTTARGAQAELDYQTEQWLAAERQRLADEQAQAEQEAAAKAFVNDTIDERLGAESDAAAAAAADAVDEANSAMQEERR